MSNTEPESTVPPAASGVGGAGVRPAGADAGRGREDPLLILGAGYIGARLAELALDEGRAVVLADNWYATKREQLQEPEARGARVETADIRALLHNLGPTAADTRQIGDLLDQGVKLCHSTLRLPRLGLLWSSLSCVRR